MRRRAPLVNVCCRSGLSARWRCRRVGAQVPVPGFSRSDAENIARVGVANYAVRSCSFTRSRLDVFPKVAGATASSPSPRHARIRRASLGDGDLVPHRYLAPYPDGRPGSPSRRHIPYDIEPWITGSPARSSEKELRRRASAAPKCTSIVTLGPARSRPVPVRPRTCAHRGNRILLRVDQQCAYRSADRRGCARADSCTAIHTMMSRLASLAARTVRYPRVGSEAKNRVIFNFWCGQKRAVPGY